MIIREIRAKTILSRSRVYDYAVNPYVGCTHACVYCYARFMKRFTGHREPWGTFVDVKVNAVELLRKTVAIAKPGRVWISGVCDPYQPVEKKYRLTWGCLEVLLERGWPVIVQTKSPLVLRDIDLLRGQSNVEAGMSVATADEKYRKIFEPGAPPVGERIKTLGVLHDAGIRTFAMVAPLLPGAEQIPARLAGKVDGVLLDRLNYRYADWVYRKYHLEKAAGEAFFNVKSEELARAFAERDIECRNVS